MVKDFRQYLDEYFVVFDGAMGTMLQQSSAEPDKCPELLNIDNPSIVEGIHRAYKDAGSDVIETNTFGGNALKLSRWGLESKVREINMAAVYLAKNIMGDDGWVAASIGPTGHLMKPFGDLSFDEAYSVFKEQMMAAAAAGADILCVETMSDINEARAAILAGKENTDLPIVATMTFETNRRTLMGNHPASVALALSAAGADAVGVNCSGGIEVAYDVVEQMAGYNLVPLMAQPNAGIPYNENGRTVYPLKPEQMSQWMDKFVKAGVVILGGCCGTTPKHIELLAAAFKHQKRIAADFASIRIISSGSKFVTADQLNSLHEIDAVPGMDIFNAVMDGMAENPDAVVLDFAHWRGTENDICDFLNEITSVCKAPLIFRNAADNVLGYLLRYYGGRAGVIGDNDHKLIDRYRAVLI